MPRRLIFPSPVDLTAWPTVLPEAMPPARAKVVKRRIEAVRLYFSGTPLSEIKKVTGIDRRKLHIFVRRCLSDHRDGRIKGFRGCAMYDRRRPYARTAPSPAISKRARSGHSGLFHALIERFPSIAEGIVEAAHQSTKGRFSESLLRVDKLHRLFLSLCEKAGLKKHDYPFNVESLAERSFARWLKKELVRRGARRAVNASLGEAAATRLSHLEDAVRGGAITLPYDRVELDGYRVDGLMTILVPDPVGGEPLRVVLERIWLLAVVDRASRAVLGYHVSLARNYSGEDVLICLENALVPWKPRTLVAPGLQYPTGAGLPSGVIAALEFARWSKLAFDNAKANCSNWVWETVSEKVGCTLSPGPVATPNARPAIERLFRELAQNGFQRLATTTGSSLSDPRRRDPESVAIRYNVHIDEMLDLIDVMIAQYNATPCEGLYGRSPLDYLRFSLERKSFFVRQIPEPERQHFELAVVKARVKVNGRIAAGESPYVQFLGVRYHSPKLSASHWLIKKTVTVQCSSRDLRRLKMFLDSGEEFDVLNAAQAWAYQPHDLRTRKAILKCIRRGKIERRGAADVVAAYIQIKKRQSYAKKKPRNELQHILRLKETLGTKAEPKMASSTDVVPPEGHGLKRQRAPHVALPAAALNF